MQGAPVLTNYGWAVRLCIGLPALSLCLAAYGQAVPAKPPATRSECPSLLQQRFKRLQDETPQELCQFAGKVLLIVNTASYCGFTSQYEGLEKLYGRFGGDGLVVLGFPSNDFGQQEPGNSQQIADFCFNTYAVRFPMFAKSVVAGKDANPLFMALARATGKPPAWNFHKYVVDRKGRVIATYPGEVVPGDPALMATLNKALSEK